MLLMYNDVIITQNMLVLSVKLYFFLVLMQILLLFLLPSFYLFILKVRRVESARRKGITDEISNQLHVDTDINKF